MGAERGSKFLRVDDTRGFMDKEEVTEGWTKLYNEKLHNL
jgi:hypothetical protein